MASNFDSFDRAQLQNELRTVLLNTEHSGLATNYVFSNAGGKSAWSFGLTQIDVRGNPRLARPSLQAMGFSAAQIDMLASGAAIPPDQMNAMNAILASHKNMVDNADAVQINASISALDEVISQVAITRPDVAATILSDTTLQLKILDYANQFNLKGASADPGASIPTDALLLKYLRGENVTLDGGVFQIGHDSTLTADDIADFETATREGVQHPDVVANRNDRFDTAIQVIQSNRQSSSSIGMPLGSVSLDDPSGPFPYSTPELAGSALALYVYKAPVGAGIGGVEDVNAQARADLASAISRQLANHEGLFTVGLANDGSVIVSGADGVVINFNTDLSGSISNTVSSDGAGSFETFDSTGAVTSDSETSVTSDGRGGFEKSTISMDSGTQLIGISVEEQGQIATTTNSYDSNGLLTSTTTVGIDSSTVTTYGDPQDFNVRTITTADQDGNIESTTTITRNANGTYTKAELDPAGNTTSSTVINPPPTSQLSLDQVGTGAVDLLQAITALRNGDPTNAAIDGLKLVQTLSNSATFGNLANAAGGVQGLVGLIQGIHGGNVIGAIQGGITLAGDGASLLNALGQNSSFYSFMDTGSNAISEGVSSYLNSLSQGLGSGVAQAPGLSFVDLGLDLAKGDYIDAAIDAISIVNPALGAAAEIIDLLYNLFAGPSRNYIYVPPDFEGPAVSLGNDIEDTLSFSASNGRFVRSLGVELGTGNNLVEGTVENIQLEVSSKVGRDTVTLQKLPYSYIAALNILFANDLQPKDIALERSGNDMIFHVGNTGGEVTVTDWFIDPNRTYATETFSDGTVWDAKALADLPLYILGGSSDSTYTAAAGYGNVIVTGNGNDIVNADLNAKVDIVGGTGSSIFNIGIQAQTELQGYEIANISTTSGNDTINLGPGVGAFTVDFGSGNNVLRFTEADDPDYTDNAGGGEYGASQEIRLGTGNNLVSDDYTGTTYDVTRGIGHDTISFASSYGSIRPKILNFDSSVDAADLSFSRVGNDMLISLTTGSGTITISNWFANDLSRIENFVFASGSAFTADDLHNVLIPYHGDGDLIGSVGNDEIYAGDGNDRLVTNGGSDRLHGGSGNDTFTVSQGSSAVIYTGDGDNQIEITRNASATVHLGAGNDSVAVDFADSAATIIGGAGTALIKLGDASSGNLAFFVDVVAGTGFESVVGFAGSVTLEYGVGDGNVEFANEAGASLNTLKFSVGINQSDVTAQRIGNAAIFYVANSGSITVDNWFTSSQYSFGSIQFADGSSWTQDNVNSALSAAAGRVVQANEVLGTIGNDVLSNYVTGEILDGLGGNDTFVSASPDGGDTFVFKSGYGLLELDTFLLNGSRPNVLALGAGISISNLRVSASGSGTALVLGDGIIGDQIIIAGSLSYASTSGVQRVEFADGTALSLADLIEMETTGTTGADQIYGSNAADLIDGKGGNDIEYGQGGSDTFFFQAGYGHLEIKENFSGSDQPILRLGNGIGASQAMLAFDADSNLILTDSVSGDRIQIDGISWSALQGIQQLQFADGTSWSRAQMLEKAGEISGSAAADTLTGSTGADVLDGHGGNDIETGKGGNDTFIFNSGYGHLEINEIDFSSAPLNILKLGSGIRSSSLTVDASSNGTGLVLADGIAGDQITIDNALSGSYYGVQDVQFDDGTILTALQLLKMELTGTIGDDIQYGTSAGDLFDGKGGNDYESGNGGGDTFVFNAGYGKLEIKEIDFSSSPHNVLRMGTGLSKSTLTVKASSDHSGIVLTDGISGDQISLDNALYGSYYGVQQVQFSDGSVLSAQQLIEMETIGTVNSDMMYGSTSGDFFDGKGGIDYESGGGGGDTFAFDAGYGQLEIDEFDLSASPHNVLRMRSGITESALNVKASSNHSGIVLTDGVSGDQITLDNALSGSYYGVQEVQFDDGTLLSSQELIRMETTGASGNDMLYGTPGGDLFDGKGGTDFESGGGGGDTFVFDAGYGQLEISEFDLASTPDNVLQFGAGVTPSDLSVVASGDGQSLLLTDNLSGDQITLDNALRAAYYGVQEARFSDGATLNVNQLIAMSKPLTGTLNADTLSGTQSSEVFDGKGGADAEIGDGGNDTYILGKGYGALTIENGVSTNNVSKGSLSIANENPNSVWFQRSGSDLQIELMGTNTEATIQGWFSNSYSQLSSISITDSTGVKSVLDVQLNQLIQGMASYSAQNPGFDPTATANSVIHDATLIALVGSSYHH